MKCEQGKIPKISLRHDTIQYDRTCGNALLAAPSWPFLTGSVPEGVAVAAVEVAGQGAASLVPEGVELGRKLASVLSCDGMAPWKGQRGALNVKTTTKKEVVPQVFR